MESLTSLASGFGENWVRDEVIRLPRDLSRLLPLPVCFPHLWRACFSSIVGRLYVSFFLSAAFRVKVNKKESIPIGSVRRPVVIDLSTEVPSSFMWSSLRCQRMFSSVLQWQSSSCREVWELFLAFGRCRRQCPGFLAPKGKKRDTTRAYSSMIWWCSSHSTSLIVLLCVIDLRSLKVMVDS